MTSKFTIGQRVRVVRVGAWNGTSADDDITWCWWMTGRVEEVNRDTIGVEMTNFHDKYLGVVQFLPDELEVLDNTSGDSVE